MKRKGKLAAAAALCILLTACAKEPEDSKAVNEILSEQAYVEVVMGEAYHQEIVKFDMENDRAVISENAKWGRPGFRDGGEAGMYYGEEEGGEVYEADRELQPELYPDSYFASIQKLDLSAGDVKEAGYVIRVTKKLDLFEDELAYLTSMVMKDSYKLTGVEIEFDKECRPIRKNFQLRDMKDELKKEGLDSETFVQEFSYKTRKSSFEHDLKKVQREIEAE